MARESFEGQWRVRCRRLLRRWSAMNSSGHVGAFPCWNSDGDFGPEGVCRLVSRFLLGHGFGASPAPGGNSLFCFDSIALRVTVSAPNLARKVRQKDFLRSLRKCRASALGSRASRWLCRV